MSSAEAKVVGVLQLAEALGSVALACRHRGIGHAQFYECKRRFQLYGLEGLKDLPPVHKSHLMTTSKEVVARILVMSDDPPSWGCKRISQQLRLEGIPVSSPTAKRVLIDHDRATRY